MYLFIQGAWILPEKNNFKNILLTKLFYLRAVAFEVDPSEAIRYSM